MASPIIADTGEMEELQNVLRLQVPQDGVRLVLEGLSSLDEIRRITGDRMV